MSWRCHILSFDTDRISTSAIETCTTPKKTGDGLSSSRCDIEVLEQADLIAASDEVSALGQELVPRIVIEEQDAGNGRSHMSAGSNIAKVFVSIVVSKAVEQASSTANQLGTGEHEAVRSQDKGFQPGDDREIHDDGSTAQRNPNPPAASRADDYATL